MNINFNRLISFLPFKRNALIFVFVLIAAIYFIRIEFFLEESNITIYLKLFAWLIGSFILILVGVGFLHTLICYLHFVFNKKSIHPKIDIGLEGNVKGEAGHVPIMISLPKALLPLLGYIKIKIEFENGNLSDTIEINKYSKGFEKLLPKEGFTLIWLPDRKQYHAKGFIISFIDYLQFFRFTTYHKSSNSFYLHSSEIDISEKEINPSKTKEEVEKIKTSRKVQGDFLNYKDFEMGDDVRRIVWKIFAKNRELVIRTPEVINPYASHIRFHTSFFNLISKDPTSAYAISMLNYYKDIVYNICMNIKKKDKKIEFNIDQAVNEFVSVTEKDRIGFQLSSANWQNNFSANELKMSGESILCVSSLIRIEELTTLVEKESSNIIIVFVSRHLDNQNLFNFKNLFLRKDEKTELNKLGWFLSKTRGTVKRNEKEIMKLVSNSNFQGQIL
ncbi:DUF58 domain-containing protein [Psychroserpens ponticola]|uniref:DUF58 domain-containing protein n=1 Tax=Psychroserpens ponticola TaxID=2932268 RepID=A0ABY7RX98_9FLAO|nr:DUF58 domain-containing protein [Psychroserpens ponticola]WCO01734.1 DUF58 domain-containing protein [Psychroserpens ponticola]